MNTENARINMINQQCRAWGVLDPVILDLFKTVSREDFVPARFRHLAFADTQIPLGHGQAMLAPKEEARILDALQIQPNDRVFEVGTGSGFLTALLAQKAKHVDSVDIFEDFMERATQKLAECNVHNVSLQVADALAKHKKNINYDIIVISGSLLSVPKQFFQQLNLGGRIFCFIGKSPVVEATMITHLEKDVWKTEKLFETYVAPLVNAVEEGFVF